MIRLNHALIYNMVKHSGLFKIFERCRPRTCEGSLGSVRHKVGNIKGQPGL